MHTRLTWSQCVLSTTQHTLSSRHHPGPWYIYKFWSNSTRPVCTLCSTQHAISGEAVLVCSIQMSRISERSRWWQVSTLRTLWLAVFTSFKDYCVSHGRIPHLNNHVSTTVQTAPNQVSPIRGLAKRLLFAVDETPPDIVNDLFHLCSGAVMWRLTPL